MVGQFSMPLTEAHVPTPWQPYHTDSGSHGQLFRPFLGLSTWHSRRVNERGIPVYQRPFIAEASAKHSFIASTTVNKW